MARTTMTVETIELRKILSQMLADNGINRETIVSFVKEIIGEKVDNSINRIIHETNIDDYVRKSVADTIKKELAQQVSNDVSRMMRHCGITIEMRNNVSEEFLIKDLEKNNKNRDRDGSKNDN